MTHFISEIKVKQGLSNIEQATSRAILMLGTSTGDARQALAILADVGPEELNPTGNSQLRLHNLIQSWTASPSRDRRFISLYSGQRQSSEREFFRLIGDGPNSAFCEQPTEIFTTTFAAIFAPKHD